MGLWGRWGLWFALALMLSGLALNPLYAQADDHREIFIPMVPNSDSVATPVPTRFAGEPVYGLLGVLLQPPGRRYETYLATADGKLHGLVGVTADVEIQIMALARSTVPTVKVWGELREDTGESEIVVTGILATEAPPPVGGASVPVAVVRFAVVSLYAAPDSRAPIVGSVVLNQACNITGRNRAMSWWEITCVTGLRGWIDARLVTVQGSILAVPILDAAVAPPTPAPTPTPRPTATPQAYAGWRAEFFANGQLRGEPALVRDVPEVNFNWGSGGPGGGLPVDNFSARFQRRINFTAGYYRITAEADDGVRVWIDDQLVIDEWRGPTNMVYAVGRVLTGEHDVRVEYYEGGGTARVRVGIEAETRPPEWEASYYRGTNPSGTPALVQSEPRAQNPLDYNWSYSSPAPEVLGTDFWSARWTGTFYFESGNYVFRALADDGVRVYLDGLLVVDAWRDGYKEVSNRYLGVGDGNHTVTVEYYDRTGLALIRLQWYRDSAYTGPQ